MVAIHDEVENEGHSQKEKQKEDDLFSPFSRFNQKRKLQKKEAVIIEWQNHHVLFNASHSQYYIKDKRRIALDSARKNLSNYEPEIDPIPPVEEMLKKLNGLRTYFNSERNKVEQLKLSENGTDDVYKSSWQFFDQLQFLSDNVTPRNTHSNIKN